MTKRKPSECIKTEFINSGRIAGIGISEGNYTEDSFPDSNPFRYKQPSFIHKQEYDECEVVIYKAKKERGNNGN